MAEGRRKHRPGWPPVILPLLAVISFAAPGADQVWRVHTDDPRQIAWLKDHFDVWTRERTSGAWLVRIDEQDIAQLDALHIPYTVDIALSAGLDRPFELTGLAGEGVDFIAGFPCYRTVPKTHTDLAALAAAHPDLAEWRDIGDSWRKIDGTGGFDLFALVLANRLNGRPKSPFVIIAAMHAREYATAELAARFAERLIDGYGTDPDITWLLDFIEIHIIAQLNPDGRVLAEQNATRFKRKNDDADFCPADTVDRGIDLNRNSSVLWGGGSTAACNETFRGPAAGSEPETQAIEAYLSGVLTDQRPGPPDDLGSAAPATTEGLFISLHSFGELVLFPWEQTPINSANHAALRTLGRKLAFFNGYRACQDCLGTASGTTVDFAYGEFGVAAYTFEIGNNFFESCQTFEQTVLPDNLEALLFAAKAARRPYLEPAAPEVIDLAVTPSAVPSDGTLTVTAVIDDTRRRSTSDDPSEPPDTANDVTGALLSVALPGFAGGMEIPFTAADGAFDSPVEAVVAILDGALLPPGRSLVFATGSDNDGSGVASAVFVDSEELIFGDGFESSGSPREIEHAR